MRVAHGGQDRLAGARPRDGRGCIGLFLEHALQRLAQLVEVGLRLRLDRDLQGRARGSRAAAARRACSRSATSVSPVWVLASLATARDVARPDLRHVRPAPCPCRPSRLPMRSSALRVAFQTWPCARERAGEDAEVGEAADERVGGRLEDLRHERADRVAARSRLPSVVGRARRPPPARECAWRSCVSSSRTPMFFVARCRRRPGTTVPSRVPLWSAASISSSLIGSPSRYFVHQLVARLGRGLDQRLAPRAAPRRLAARRGSAPPSACRSRRRWRAARSRRRSRGTTRREPIGR